MLTILLPLKGRELHTLRFLWHANKCCAPYHFSIADGGTHPLIAGLLQQARKIFPNLDIAYTRHPDDVNYTRFYQKIATASAGVNTPYVMLADNDDFLVRSGVDACVAFLQSHPDFASCSGAVGGFGLSPAPDPALNNIVGPLQYVSIQCMPEYAAREDTAASIAERIRKSFSCIQTDCYNVFRTDILATILRELEELNLTDLHLHEVYLGMRAVSLGKARLSHRCMSYMRQGGTGLGGLFRTDWAAHIVRSRFTTDLDAVAHRISEIVAASDGLPADELAAEIRDLFGVKLGKYLRSQYGSPNSPKVSWGRRLKTIAQGVLPKKLMTSVHYARTRDLMFRDFRTAGASEATIDALRKEWKGIESLLTGSEFVEFLRQHAAPLLAAPAHTTGFALGAMS